MDFQLILVGAALIIVALRLRVGMCADVSVYTNCSVPYSCGKDVFSYPFWGADRPIYCGVSWFGLKCRQNRTEIEIASQRYRVLNISIAHQIITIARADEWIWEGYNCPAVYLNASLSDSGIFGYGPDIQEVNLFYGCPFDLDLIQDSRGSNCINTRNTTNVMYLKAEFGPKKQNRTTSKCEGSILVPVHPTDSNWSMQSIFKTGFTLTYSASYHSNCASCIQSGGVCGRVVNDDNFICYCHDGNSQTSICPDHSTNSGRRTLLVIVGSVSGLSIIVVLLLLIRWKRKPYSFVSMMLSTEAQLVEDTIRSNGYLGPRRYKYSDIKRMTNSFKNKLGQGGFGTVYKGKLLNNQLVAVKLMKESKGNGEDFINEVASISRTSHVNVVNLLGFCFDGSQRALIYEFMPNGSLEKFIYKENPLEMIAYIRWEILFEIVVGISRGFEYLHRGCNTRILHFDIKPHNILLDEDFCPKISDFGLAKLCSTKDSLISVGARGTAGYIAPEVFDGNFGGVSHKSDVYSFGMMVLEIVGGRKNINGLADRTSEIYFPQWIYTRIELNKDLGLHGITSEIDDGITKKMILVGLWCIQTNPSDRPSMSKVVEMLEGNFESLPMPPKLFFSPPITARSYIST